MNSRLKAGRSSTQGFSLVELMVVVAMVGIMAAISIPAYNRYIARARATEAKIGLAAIYISEISFRTENQSFSACLFDLGFEPVGANRYFRLGFSLSAAQTSGCGNNGNAPCSFKAWANTTGTIACALGSGMTAGNPYAYPATATMTPGVFPSDADLAGTSLTSDTFIAGAAGPTAGALAKSSEGLFESLAYAANCNNYDAYTINEQKMFSILPACGASSTGNHGNGGGGNGNGH